MKDEACAECHQAISDSYAQTAMARSWSRPAAAQLIENFESPNEVTDPKTGFRYRAVRDGDRFFQREYRVDDQGQEVDFQVREVAYVLGSGTKGRSYVTDSNGYLTIMPIAWYSGEGRWDLNPGYREFNEGFDREIRPRCISCHNSYPDYVAGSSNRYREPAGECR